jgi:hypothetical protein
LLALQADAAETSDGALTPTTCNKRRRRRRRRRRKDELAVRPRSKGVLWEA